MNNNFHRNLLGFTLIELMITVTIIGIIAAIAFPAYNEYILKTHRAEGKSMLIQAIAHQERFHIANNKYATGLDAQGLNYTNNQSEHGYYSLDIEDETKACPISICYEMTVTAIGTQAADTECAQMSQTSTGRKKAFSASGGDETSECW